MTFKHVLLIFCFPFTMSVVSAQELQKTDSGELIVVMPDGSYESFDKNNPEHAKLKKGATTVSDIDKLNKKIQKLEKEQEELKNIVEKAETLDNTVASAVENRKKVESELASLQHDFDLKLVTAGKVNACEKLLYSAKAQEKDWIKEQKEANFEAKRAKDRLDKLKPELAALKSEKTNEVAVYKAGQSQKTTSKIVEEKEPNLAVNLGRRKTTKTEDKPPMPSTDVAIDVPAQTEKAVVNTKNVKPENNEMVTKVKKEIEKKVITTAPVCNVVFDGIDDFTKKTRKELKKAPLFAQTDDAFKNYFTDVDYISGEANLSLQDNNYFYLNLTFTIASDNTANSFGVLEKGTPITIRMMNGDMVILQTNRTDRGLPDSGHNKTVYTAVCPLGSDAEKKLRTGEIDLMRVAWGNGFEDYDLYDLDLISNQFKCFVQR